MKKVLPSLTELRNRPKVKKVERNNLYTFSMAVDRSTAKELIEKYNGYPLGEGQRVIHNSNLCLEKEIQWKVYQGLTSNYTGD